MCIIWFVIRHRKATISTLVIAIFTFLADSSLVIFILWFIVFPTSNAPMTVWSLVRRSLSRMLLSGLHRGRLTLIKPIILRRYLNLFHLESLIIAPAGSESTLWPLPVWAEILLVIEGLELVLTLSGIAHIVLVLAYLLYRTWSIIIMRLKCVKCIIPKGGHLLAIVHKLVDRVLNLVLARFCQRHWLLHAHVWRDEWWYRRWGWWVLD